MHVHKTAADLPCRHKTTRVIPCDLSPVEPAIENQTKNQPEIDRRMLLPSITTFASLFSCLCFCIPFSLTCYAPHNHLHGVLMVSGVPLLWISCALDVSWPCCLATAAVTETTRGPHTRTNFSEHNGFLELAGTSLHSLTPSL